MNIQNNSDEFNPESKSAHAFTFSKNIPYLFVGIVFGITLVKAEVVSWFRIQEMFRFDSFHMYGVIGTAVVVGMISVAIIKRFKIKTIKGEDIKIEPKKFSISQIFGGLIFGIGWAFTGACPGPLFALVGSGFLILFVSLLSAVLGTLLYGIFKERLPH
jgi:uncharacterized membrane protein YedE/YeeE